MEDRIVTLASYNDPMLAEIILARLLDNGIECFIADGNTIGANPLFSNAIGGVKIKVFEHDLERCHEILQEQDDLQITDELPEEHPITCPYCGSTNVRYGTSTGVKTNWFGAVLSFLFFVYPPFAHKAWHCFNCEKEFQEPV